MPDVPAKVWLYHITQIDNLRSIIVNGGLHSDAGMRGRAQPSVIGYANIKERRLTEYVVPCRDNAFVGQFVPFYFCPRSPMLFTVNKGNTGLAPGCQRTIVHLCVRLEVAELAGRHWAISDGNAGAAHTIFYADRSALALLDWEAIRATNWSGRQHQKQAEFLVRDFFPWDKIEGIGVFNQEAKTAVDNILVDRTHKPSVAIKRDWYY